MVLIEEVRATRRFSPDMAAVIRQAAGISQTRLAAEIGVKQSTVARWEAGERRPRGERGRAYFALLHALWRELRDQ